MNALSMDVALRHAPGIAVSQRRSFVVVKDTRLGGGRPNAFILHEGGNYPPHLQTIARFNARGERVDLGAQPLNVVTDQSKVEADLTKRAQEDAQRAELTERYTKDLAALVGLIADLTKEAEDLLNMGVSAGLKDVVSNLQSAWEAAAEELGDVS